MSRPDLPSLLVVAVQAARVGADQALRGFRQRGVINRKQGTELVTEFDLASEHAIKEYLSHAFPSIPVVGEEEGGAIDSPMHWLVDPIDGTTNFAHGHPFWAVSIGLAIHGVPHVGCVFAPCLDCTWTGFLGGPSERNGQSCFASTVSDFADAFLATGFPYDRQTSEDNNLAAFASLQKQAVGIRRCGSAAIDLCLVADGTYDGFWEHKLRPWDLCAGTVIAWGAGAIATDYEGGEAILSTGTVVAGNPQIQPSLLARLQDVQRSRGDRPDASCR